MKAWMTFRDLGRRSAGVVALCVVATVSSGQGTWSTPPGASPTQRRGASLCAVNGVIFAIGGAAPGSTSSVNTVESFDPSSNAWTPRPSLPIASQQLAAVTVAGKLYAIGGGSCCAPSSSVQIYDSTSNSWSVANAMPTARYAPGAAVANGVIYVLGGASGFGNAYTNLEALDTSIPNAPWVQKAPLPAYRGNLALASVNGRLYAIGGATLGGTLVATTEAYDPATNSWTPRASMLTPRSSAAAIVIGGLIYVIGGDTPVGISPAVEAYDPDSNTWTSRAPVPLPLYGRSGTAVGSAAYVAGNVIPYPAGAPLTVERFDPLAYPGTNDDFAMTSALGLGLQTSGLGRNVRGCSGGTTVTVHLASAGGAFNFAPLLLLAQQFTIGSPPSPIGPNVWVGTTFTTILGATAGPLGPILLSPAGMDLSFSVPVGFAGSSVILQAGVLSAGATNHLYATSEALELQIR